MKWYMCYVSTTEVVFDPSTLGSTFFSFSLFFNPCITAYGLLSLEDNIKYVAALSSIFLRPVLKVM